MNTIWEAKEIQMDRENGGIAKLMDAFEQSWRLLCQMIVGVEERQKGHQTREAAQGMAKRVVAAMASIEDLWCRIRQMIEEAEAAQQAHQARTAAQGMARIPEADMGYNPVTGRFLWEMNQVEQAGPNAQNAQSAVHTQLGGSQTTNAPATGASIDTLPTARKAGLARLWRVFILEYNNLKDMIETMFD